MIGRISKKVTATIFIFLLFLSYIPTEVISGWIQKQAQDGNIVDNMWGVDGDKNVIDKLIPLSKALQRLKTREAEALVANNGMIMKGNNASAGTFYYMTVTNPNTFGAETTTGLASSASGVAFVVEKASPVRDEKLSGHLKVDGRLDVVRRNSAGTYSADLNVVGASAALTCDATAGSCWRPFDLGYEQLSGQGMVAYGKNATAGAIFYNTWNGSAWAGETQYTVTGSTGVPKWVRLIPEGDQLSNKRTDRILMIMMDANSDIFAAVWNGSAWGNLTTITTTTSVIHSQTFDGAWETNTGNAMVVYADGAANSTTPFKYKRFITGTSTWDAAGTTIGAWTTSIGRWASVSSSPKDGVNNIAILLQASDATTITTSPQSRPFVWNGSAMSAGNALAAAEPLVGANIGTAFEKLTGDAIFTYTASNSTSDVSAYQTWNGAFSASADVTGAMGDDSNNLSLIGSPNSDEVRLMGMNIDKGVQSQRWSGTAWNAAYSAALGTVVYPGLANTNQEAFGYAYAWTPYSPWSRNWRWYDDEGSATPATPLANENVTASVSNGNMVRLRFQAAELGGMAATASRKKLQYTSCADPNLYTCTWTDVDAQAGAGIWRYVNGAGADDATFTTTVLTGSDATGVYVENGTAASTFGHGAAGSTSDIPEWDYSIQNNGATNGTTYYFRMWANDQNLAVLRDQTNNSSTYAYPSATGAAAVSALTVGTSGSQTTPIDSGTANTYLGGAFTFSLSAGSANITGIKVSNNGTAGNLSDVRLYYDTDGTYSGTESCFNTTCGDGQGGALGSSIAGSLALTSGTTYYVYVIADVANTVAGGLTVDLQITNPSTDITTTAQNTDTVAKNITSATTVRPNVTGFTNSTDGSLADGAREGHTLTINGTGFGTTCNIGSGSKVSIGAYDLSCTGATFNNTSITISVESGLPDNNNGGTGASGLLVTIGNSADDARQNFYVYPTITSLTVPTAVTDAAREYSALDSDGLITVNGNHFGTPNGSNPLTILGTNTSGYGVWNDTQISNVQIPTAIANNSYTGSIILTRNDSRGHSYAGFRVLPRIASTAPVDSKGGRGDVISIAGDHLCQSGSCPTSFSAADSVNFAGGSVTSGASTWTDTSIPSVTVPAGSIDGNLNITSNTSYTSNNLTYNIKFAPSTPTNGNPAGQSNIGLNPTLNGSAFDDGTDGDTQTDSDWQIDEEGTFATPEWSESLSAANTSIVVNNTNGAFAGLLAGQTTLACGKTYSFRVRYKDNGAISSQEWSSWSTTSTFNTQSCGPDATSFSNSTEGALADGGRIGQTIVITGASFGTVNAGSRANCGGGAGTGCIKIGGTGGQTVADANVTAWSDTSITITLSLTDLSTTYGGATTNGIVVYAAAVADPSPLTFYVYPDITSITTALGSNTGAREYAAADSDGIITITGNKFGTAPTGGSAVIVGGTVATFVADGTCDASDGWAETCIKVQVPTTINDATDSGFIIVTQGSGSNNKASNSTDAQGALNIWPRVTGISAASFADGGYQNGTFTLSGSHFGASAGTISVNGANQDGSPTWAAASITSVGIPDTGTDSGSITLTRSDTRTSNSYSTFYIYPQITGFTNTTDGSLIDGGRQAHVITITGNHFGTGGGNSNILVNTVNPSATTPTWGAGSITNVDIPNTGADSGNITVTNPQTSKTSNTSGSFYIYPTITSMTVPTANPDAGREYAAADSDGVITVNGNHFGAAGTVSILGSSGTQQTTATCVGSAYQTTCVGLQIPTAIADNSYTGNAVITRNADSKTHSYSGFRVLPRIVSTAPTNLKGGIGDTVSIAGDHLCQSGTCPTAFAASDKVSFAGPAEVTSGASAWAHTSIPSIVIPGGATDGNLNMTSNTSYTSNNLTYNIKFAPSTPTNGNPAGQSGIGLNPTLNGSAFSDGTDGDAQSDSQWEIDEEGTFASPEWTESLSAANTSIVVNNTNGAFANNLAGQTSLGCSKTYSFHVRYKDNGGIASAEWSSWSTASTFSTSLCSPNATSFSNSTEGGLADGGRIGHTIVVSGTNFGTVNAGSRANCVGGLGTGCVKIGGVGGQTIADANVTAWSDTSITVVLSLTDLSTVYGGTTTGGLIVYGAGVSDSDGLTFHVYPDITSITTALGSNTGAREYAAADSDGIITITGNKFGTAPTGGSAVIVGGTVATFVADGTCDASDGWADTCIKVQVPTTINDATDSGFIIVTQGSGPSTKKSSNSTDAQGALDMWPRVTGISAASFADGGYQNGTFTLSGSHFGASAGTVSVNGANQDGSPTWGASSITSVGIPDTGTDSGQLTLTRSDTKTSNSYSTFYIYPQITGFTNTTDGSLIDGGRQAHVITITGNHFGTGGGNSNILVNTVNPSATTPTWGAGSITNVDIPNTGADSGVITVTNPVTGKTSNNSSSFYIYPTITSLTVPTVNPDAAREYSASDSDGVITVNGNHFGAAGNITLLGSSGTQQITGTCTGNAYQATCSGLQTPTAIADNSYTGNVVLTRNADSKTHSYAGFRVLPRILSFSPANPGVGDNVEIIGNHLCQAGAASCPAGLDVNNKVTFASSADASSLNSWGNGDSSTSGINVAVPGSAVSGDVIIKSNTYDSNVIAITLASNIPNDPSALNQFKDSGYLSAIAVGGAASSTTIYFQMTMQSPIGGGTLYPQIEIKSAGTPFDCSGGGACGSASEGAGQASPGPATGQVSSILSSNISYHWQMRVRHNKGGADYYSNWVSFGGNGDPNGVDFYIDATAPTIGGCAGMHSDVTAAGATISWTPSDALSTTFTKQAEYTTDSTFTASSCTPGSTCGTHTSGYLAGQQSIILTGLSPNTTYYYRARSMDEAGNEGVAGYGLSGETACTFTTSKAETKTTEFFVTAKQTAQNQGDAEYAPTFSVYIPEDGYSIQSAFIEMTGVFSTDGTPPSQVRLRVNAQTPIDYSVGTSNSVVTPFNINHLIPIENLNVASPANPSNSNTFGVSVLDASTSVSIISAKIIVTYYHTPVQ